MKKKFIALALCLLMLCNQVLPVAAVAADAAAGNTDLAAAYYQSMSEKGAQYIYENWDYIPEAQQTDLLNWLETYNSAMYNELKALLGSTEPTESQPQETETQATEPEATTQPAETEPEETAQPTETEPEETTQPTETEPEESTEPQETEPEETVKTLAYSGFSVTGKDIPEDAEFVVQDYPVAYSAETSSVSMYNIKVYDGDEVWQPADGETVEISIPVTDSASGTVDIIHFLEDPAKISYALANGSAVALDVSGAPEEVQELFEASIQGYRKAANTTGTYVVVENFENVPVVDGQATVNANGFSIFIANGKDENGNTIYLEKDLTDIGAIKDLNQTIYVRPGEWIRLTGVTLFGGFAITSGNQYVTQLDGGDFAWIGGTDIYFHVNDDAQKGNAFEITLYYFFGLGSVKVKFQVVDDFDYGKVRICVLPQNYEGFPNELSNYTNVGFNFYTTSDTLTTTNTVYSQYPRTLIDVDNLKKSNYYVSNDTQTVYGISDSTGAITGAYLTDDFDAIAENILKQYYGDNWGNYKLIVYAVKYEAVGDNVGWYINCKTELKSNFILSYDYNAPSPLTEFDIGTTKKPSAQSVSTYDGDTPKEAVTATVSSGAGMELSKTIDTTSYKATFVGWNTNPNADPNETNKTAANGWYFGGDTITMTGDTTLYAIWKLDWKPTIADVEFQKHVVDENGNDVTGVTDDFTFTMSSNFAGTSYKVYTADGLTQVTSGTFSASALTFTLKNGQYIVIEDVPNSTTAYTITETVPDGYTAQNGATTTININETTNSTGKFTSRFINVLKKYTVTYDDGVADEEIVVPAAQEKIYGVDLTLSSTKPERAGYDFNGWKGSDGNTYQAGAVYTTDAALTLTAQWKLKSYTVTYNTNGGTGTYANQTKEHGKALTLYTNEPTKAGYTFAGWLGSDNVTYQAGGPYTANADLTLTAQWTPANYTITYNLNGGTVTGNPTGYTIESAAITLNNPTKTGYTFAGWTGTDLAGAQMNVTIPTGSTGDRAYTATWTPIEYTISYHGLEGATVSGNPTGYTIESDDITLSNPTKDGYAFAGWTGTGLTAATESVTITKGSMGNREYTATWTPLYKYELVFDDNTTDEVTNMPEGYSSTAWEANASYTHIWTAEPTRTGYTFLGWSTESDAAEASKITSYTLNGTAADTTKVTLYAIWQINKYTVTWKNWDGSVLETDTDVPYGTKPTYDGEKPEKASDPQYNYVFAGWSPEVSAVGESDVTYTATYTPVLQEYTVKWVDEDGTTVLEMDENVAYGTTPEFNGATPTKASAEGYAYTFDTWTPEISKVVGNVAYKATYKATPIDYTVTFETNGGTLAEGASGTASYTVETAITLPGVTRPGYTFKGWKVTVAAESDTNWKLDDTYTAEIEAGKYGDVTLTAQWEAITADLVIQTTLSASACFADQNFVFVVTGTADDVNVGKIEFEVALNGSDRVTIAQIPAGSYTITEKSGWSWRYTGDQTAAAEIEDAEAKTVTFTFDDPDNTSWLSGYHMN